MIEKLVEPPASHICSPPCCNPESKYGIGTIWKCDICGRRAEFEDDLDGYLWQCIYENH